MSTNTAFAQSFRPNHVAAIITRDGERVGHVVMRGAKFNAHRKTGTATDMRRMATGFKTAQAAAAWVAA